MTSKSSIFKERLESTIKDIAEGAARVKRLSDYFSNTFQSEKIKTIESLETLKSLYNQVLDTEILNFGDKKIYLEHEHKLPNLPPGISKSEVLHQIKKMDRNAKTLKSMPPLVLDNLEEQEEMQVIKKKVESIREMVKEKVDREQANKNYERQVMQIIRSSYES